METSKRHFIFFILVLLFLNLFFTACGRKGVPVPPGTLRPERIKDLSYKIVKEGAIITWSVPYKNLDGSPIDKIREFRLFRAEIPIEGNFCKECPPRYGAPIVIEYDKKPEPGKKIIYEDTTVREGYYYIYQVKTVKNLLNVSDFSNKIIYAWHSPPSPPFGLEANVLEEGIRLTWNPPEKFEDGKVIDGQLSYRIFRRFDDEDSWTKIVDSTYENSFFDKIRRVYTKAEYSIVAIYSYHDTEIFSSKSTPIVVRARGQQHIPSPKLLRLFVTKKGIVIKWKPLNRPGIVGYFIYRKEPNKIVIPLNNKPISGTEFVDRTILRPGKYTYWISAIDDSIPPNESDPSNQKSIIIK